MSNITVNEFPAQSPSAIRHNNNNDCHPRVILVIGSIGIDRLLSVPKFPLPDSKVRTTSYYEVGGGNAANSAAAMGKLSNVGRDATGEQLISELRESHVDTSSPLFCRGPVGSTTSFCTILVDESEHTRTCLFTPGTAGHLTMEDARDIWNNQESMDTIFDNVVHVHSDARLTEVSLALAKEATKRGIPVSVDCEKDRDSHALDELLNMCEILFTNESCLEEYIHRLTTEKEREYGRCELPKPTIKTDAAGCCLTLHETTIDVLVKAVVTPNSYLARWQIPMKKEVIVTQGSMGAIHLRPIRKTLEYVRDASTASLHNVIVIKQHDHDVSTPMVIICHTFCDKSVRVEVEYEVRLVGVLRNVHIVDTTGAGDAFIGGYILSRVGIDQYQGILEDQIQFQLEFGTFVGGKKLEGPGARTALPTCDVVDATLGTELQVVARNLKEQIGPFNAT
ncbi:ribokinase [Nitzschia inconspicua]|uniref:Ribokinase n=1 Tax=Nitzschia inconspicua TaxID=303405 RepID=A0A9K3L2F8_9STRA|nr:ribokinase [Nitzschia inconspicua]